MRRRSWFGVWGGERLTDGDGQRWRFLSGGGRRWEAEGRVEVRAREVGERHVGEAKLFDGSARLGNHRRRPALERCSRRMKNSASANLASRRPMARGWLLSYGRSWAHEGGGPGCLDTEASRRRPVGGAARRLVKQRRSTVEEQSEKHFMWGSEKRRRTSLGVELHVGVGRPTASVRGWRVLAETRGYSAVGGWQVDP
jgi:hypothetical protein